MNTYRRWAALVLVLLFFGQVMDAATQLSLTSDEGPQLTSAYAYLTTGDTLLIEYDGHPPLAKIWNALPLLLVPDLGSPADAPSWHSPDPISLLWVTQEFYYPYQPLERIVLPPRAMAALLGVLLLAVIHRWATDLFGVRAGLLALFVATFDPNLLAHAGLATNDLAVTLGCTTALFASWRFLRRPALRRALAAGLVLGLAQSTKLNAALLLPIMGLLFLVRMVQLHRTGRRETLPPFFWQSCALFGVAALALWATYGFEVRPVAGLPLPLPAGSHLLLWERVLKATGGGHPAFLMGEFSTEGWGYYFPVAFAIKTPLPTLLLLLAGGVALLRGQRRPWEDELALWAFTALYGIFIIYSRLNIGYRHMMPVLPLLYVGLAGRAGRMTNGEWRMANGREGQGKKANGRITNHVSRFTFHVSRFTHYPLLITHYVLLAWLALGTLTLAPHYLAHFNELVGGPDEGYRYLVDSNLDWGQAFKELARYQREHNTGTILISTHIEYDAALRSYGLDFAPLPPLHAAPGVLPRRFDPASGVYALSTTTLQGILTAEPEMYDWFRQREPDAKLGHALFVYHVTETAPPAGWIAQCSVPVTPLPADVIAEGFGRDNLRQVTFDCTQSWFWPGGDATPGWMAFFRETALGDDTFIQAQLETLHKSFEQKITGLQPPFVIYEATSPRIAPAFPSMDRIEIGDLRFLGHTAHTSTTGVEIWTYWEVQHQPAATLSVMLHLLGPDGTPLSVGDGSGVPEHQWRPGDVIVQRHRLPLPPDAPAGHYTPQTGVYTLETLERHPVSVNGQIIGDHLTLPPLTIPE